MTVSLTDMPCQLAGSIFKDDSEDELSNGIDKQCDPHPQPRCDNFKSRPDIRAKAEAVAKVFRDARDKENIETDDWEPVGGGANQVIREITEIGKPLSLLQQRRLQSLGV